MKTPIASLVITFLVIGVTTPVAHAQTFSVIHNFTGGGDGANPEAGVTVGPGGVLYGTASNGGNGYGTVFKLNRVNSSWIFSPLYEFGGGDGESPFGGVAFGPNGALYGTTFEGGSSDYGVVFELRPQPSACKSALCYWNESLLHIFTGTPDGAFPQNENLAFDQAGNIYGTTSEGGSSSQGTAFELTLSGGRWTESLLHNFVGNEGQSPNAGVILDSTGNVYGTTVFGGGTGGGCGYGCGTVYQLVPTDQGWVENVLVSFDQTGASYPGGSLIMDGSGNLYGTTSSGGPDDYGVVFKVTRSGGYTYSAIYNFTLDCDSQSGLAMDAAGDLFGVCSRGGASQDGWIFELTNCSQVCNLIDLHDFGGNDGSNPYGTPVLDANGNLYGTTAYGGTGDCSPSCGVVWEITP